MACDDRMPIFRSERAERRNLSGSADNMCCSSSIHMPRHKTKNSYVLANCVLPYQDATPKTHKSGKGGSDRKILTHYMMFLRTLG